MGSIYPQIAWMRAVPCRIPAGAGYVVGPIPCLMLVTVVGWFTGTKRYEAL
jgi:hypothetical protein